MVDQHSSGEQGAGRPFRRLSTDAIREFKEIYKAEFGVELSDAEAEEQGLRLLYLFVLLLRPPPEDTEE